jgi:hypothetical protein
LKGANIKAALSTMNVSVTLPSLVTAALGLAGLAIPTGLVVIAPAVALGLTAVLIDRNKSVTEAMNKSPVAYLLRLEKDLAPKDLVSWIIQDTKKFKFGL